jgi:UDP-2,3-diacylglucosamine pyrophosphatase LpxH
MDCQETLITEMARPMTTILISDIHLGARNNRTDLLAGLLRTDFDRLILNGDTVDSVNFRRFRACDWRIVEQLRCVAKERELVLLRGNHDGTTGDEAGFGPLDALAELLDTQWHEEYILPVGSERYLVMHGDQFDRTLNLSWVGDAADWFYRQTQRGSTSVARFLKGRVKQWGGVVDCVQRGAIRYARQKGSDGVITGHTHFAHDEVIDGVHYLNTGCWVDWPCSYVLVQSGEARLMHWGLERRLPMLSQPGLAVASA